MTVDQVTLKVLGFCMAYIGAHVVFAALSDPIFWLSDPIFWLFCLSIAGMIGLIAWRSRWQK